MSEEGYKPTLHPLYKPAVSDSILLIRFIGNTAVVADIAFTGDPAPGVDPYQLLGAGEAMKRKGFQMIQAAEVAEAKARIEAEGLSPLPEPPDPSQAIKGPEGGKKILVTDKLPPGGFKGMGVDHLKG